MVFLAYQIKKNNNKQRYIPIFRYIPTLYSAIFLNLLIQWLQISFPFDFYMWKSTIARQNFFFRSSVLWLICCTSPFSLLFSTNLFTKFFSLIFSTCIVHLSSLIMWLICSDFYLLDNSCLLSAIPVSSPFHQTLSSPFQVGYYICPTSFVLKRQKSASPFTYFSQNHLIHNFFNPSDFHNWSVTPHFKNFNSLHFWPFYFFTFYCLCFFSVEGRTLYNFF